MQRCPPKPHPHPPTHHLDVRVLQLSVGVDKFDRAGFESDRALPAEESSRVVPAIPAASNSRSVRARLAGALNCSVQGSHLVSIWLATVWACLRDPQLPNESAEGETT